MCNKIEQKGVAIPSQLTVENIDHQIHRLLNVNKVYKGGICTLLVYWQTFPLQSEPNYCIFVEPLEQLQYIFSTRGVELTYNDTIAPINSFIPNTIYKEQDETYLTSCAINQDGSILRTDKGDLLIIKDGTVHINENTEPITTVFTEYLARRNQWSIQKHNGIPKETVKDCQEIVHCGTFFGLQWINKLTYNNESRILEYDYTKQIVTEFTTFINTQG